VQPGFFQVIAMSHFSTKDAGQPHDDVTPAPGYAGDVSCQTAHRWWQSGQAVLVDVRSSAERVWVGFVPGALSVPWKEWPGLAVNPNFDEQLRATVPSDKKVLMLCRSGVRSVAAAQRATLMGLQAYNVLEGFEGDPDDNGQRNRVGG